MFRFRSLFVVLSAMFVIGLSAEEKQKAGTNPTQVKTDNAEEVKAASSTLSPRLGKEAVINRIKAMFSDTAKPIMKTKKFVPESPYMKVQDIKADASGGPARVIIVYRFRFVNAEKAIDSLETALGDAGTVEVSPTQNTIIMNVLKSHSEAMQKTILALDVPLPQIMVETQIVEVNVQNGETRDVSLMYNHTDKNGNVSSYGYNVKKSTNQATGTSSTSESAGFSAVPVSSGSDTLNIALNWLADSTDAKILASPNVIADLGTEARMETGEDLPYTENAVTSSAVSQSIKFKRTGVKLVIKPTLINKDTVQLEINPQVTVAVRYEKFEVPTTGSVPTTNNIPVVSVRNIKTSLTAADGEVIMLGGLYVREVSTTSSKVPYLSDIPLLGEAFTAKDSSVMDKQLIFFMKIHIIPTPYAVSLDMEKIAKDTRDVSDMISTSPVIFPKSPNPKLDTVEDKDKILREQKRQYLTPVDKGVLHDDISGRVPHMNRVVPEKKEDESTATKPEEKKAEK